MYWCVWTVAFERTSLDNEGLSDKDNSTHSLEDTRGPCDLRLFAYFHAHCFHLLHLHQFPTSCVFRISLILGGCRTRAAPTSWSPTAARMPPAVGARHTSSASSARGSHNCWGAPRAGRPQPPRVSHAPWGSHGGHQDSSSSATRWRASHRLSRTHEVEYRPPGVHMDWHSCCIRSTLLYNVCHLGIETSFKKCSGRARC